MFLFLFLSLRKYFFWAKELATYLNMRPSRRINMGFAKDSRTFFLYSRRMAVCRSRNLDQPSHRYTMYIYIYTLFFFLLIYDIIIIVTVYMVKCPLTNSSGNQKPQGPWRAGSCFHHTAVEDLWIESGVGCRLNGNLNKENGDKHWNGWNWYFILRRTRVTKFTGNMIHKWSTVWFREILNGGWEDDHPRTSGCT